MCGFHSITSLSHSIFCIRLRNCFPPLWSVRTWRKNKINMYLPKSLKEKALSLCVNGWGRIRPRKTLRDIWMLILYQHPVLYDQCDNNVDKTVPSWWENTHVKLISYLFIIHCIKQKDKVSRKTLVYSSVIDINQMDVIFSAINISSG